MHRNCAASCTACTPKVDWTPVDTFVAERLKQERKDDAAANKKAAKPHPFDLMTSESNDIRARALMSALLIVLFGAVAV